MKVKYRKKIKGQKRNHFFFLGGVFDNRAKEIGVKYFWLTDQLIDQDFYPGRRIRGKDYKEGMVKVV